jgi:molybdopterin-binding protein
VVAVVTRESLEHLALAPGQQVDAIFKASSVILAVAG